MSPITIHCPQCNAGLKLPNRSLLGKKGKCPKCGHRFVLADPDEVTLTLAESAPPPEPEVGLAARWVPDDAPAAPPAPAAPQVAPPQADPPLVTDPIPTGPVTTPSAPAPPTMVAGSLDLGQQAAGQQNVGGNVGQPNAGGQSVGGQSVGGQNVGGQNVGLPTGGTTNELDFASADTEEGSVATRVRGRRKRKSRTGPIVVGAGTALFAFCMFGLWWGSGDETTQAEVRQPPAINEAWEESKAQMAESNEQAQELSPTSGDRIPMQYLAVTPDLVLHLRPSEIWGAERANREFVATLSQLGVWLQSQIQTITGFAPQEIEELTLGINFGPLTSEPDIIAVVRLESEHSAFDMQVKRFKATPRADLTVPVMEGERFSYMILDKKTFAVAPVTATDLLADARSYSQEPGVELETLLAESDRKRLVTLAFDVSKIDTHRKYVFPENLQTLVDEFVLWLGKDVRTISWSLHLDSDLFMETLLKESNESSPLKVQRDMRLRLQKLPGLMVNAVRFMQPTTEGYRTMISRFPAMMQATTLGTKTHVGPGYVRMVTLLPKKAAANLAAASLLTWNQSLVTDFDGPAPAVASAAKIPDSVLERLKTMPVFVDFRNTPLQEAFSYISDEIKTPIIINGDALKLSGMTQNMPQNYDLGEVPAIRALDTIVSNPMYEGKLVIVVDENSRSISVTSRDVATESGLTIFDTKQK